MAEDFGEVWTLGPADRALVAGLPDGGRLGLAAQLAYWAHWQHPRGILRLGAKLASQAASRMARSGGVDPAASRAGGRVAQPSA